jgi:hypothetical protein
MFFFLPLFSLGPLAKTTFSQFYLFEFGYWGKMDANVSGEKQ